LADPVRPRRARCRACAVPENIIDACNQILGHLDDPIARADAEAPPKVGVTGMHPLVRGAAKGLWRDEHYKQAVHTAADAVV
jgi:hypothetical protein